MEEIQLVSQGQVSVFQCGRSRIVELNEVGGAEMGKMGGDCFSRRNAT